MFGAEACWVFTPTLKGECLVLRRIGFTPFLKPARLCKTGVACPTEVIQAGVGMFGAEACWVYPVPKG